MSMACKASFTSWNFETRIIASIFFISILFKYVCLKFIKKLKPELSVIIRDKPLLHVPKHPDHQALFHLLVQREAYMDKAIYLRHTLRVMRQQMS